MPPPGTMSKSKNSARSAKDSNGNQSDSSSGSDDRARYYDAKSAWQYSVSTIHDTDPATREKSLYFHDLVETPEDRLDFFSTTA